MPHPLRPIAGERPVYSIPVIIFIDDVSGNISTQWNKHISCYMSNGALDRETLQTEYHVRFVATSQHATATEIAQGIRKSIE
jgi:predicted methyltransferase MtxX (methanogen marker protein 4)